MSTSIERETNELWTSYLLRRLEAESIEVNPTISRNEFYCGINLSNGAELSIFRMTEGRSKPIPEHGTYNDVNEPLEETVEIQFSYKIMDTDLKFLFGADGTTTFTNESNVIVKGMFETYVEAGSGQTYQAEQVIDDIVQYAIEVERGGEPPVFVAYDRRESRPRTDDHVLDLTNEVDETNPDRLLEPETQRVEPSIEDRLGLPSAVSQTMLPGPSAFSTTVEPLQEPASLLQMALVAELDEPTHEPVDYEELQYLGNALLEYINKQEDERDYTVDIRGDQVQVSELFREGSTKKYASFDAARQGRVVDSRITANLGDTRYSINSDYLPAGVEEIVSDSVSVDYFVEELKDLDDKRELKKHLQEEGKRIGIEGTNVTLTSTGIKVSDKYDEPGTYSLLINIETGRLGIRTSYDSTARGKDRKQIVNHQYFELVQNVLPQHL